MNAPRARAALFGLACLTILGTAAPTFAAVVPLDSNGSFEGCAAACTTGQLGYAAYTQNGTGYSGYVGVTSTGWMNTSTYAYLVTSSAFSTTLGNTTITLPNARGGGGTISLWTFPTASPDGGNFIIQDADYNLDTGYVGSPGTAGGVSQSISGLTIGQIYKVGFYEALGQQVGFTGSDSAAWQVTFGGAPMQTSTVLTIPSLGFSGWTYVSLSFVATAATQLLSFASTGVGAPPFVALDGITVTVPEPTTFALVGIGLLGLVMVRHMRIKPD